MNVLTHEQLIDAVDRFQERHPEIGDSRLGRESTGESGLLARIRRGGGVTLRVAGRIAEVMAAYDAAANQAEAAIASNEGGT